MSITIFIFAHGCYLPQAIPRNPNINIYFDVAIGDHSVNDFTNPDFSTDDFTIADTNNDYVLTFRDNNIAPAMKDFIPFLI